MTGHKGFLRIKHVNNVYIGHVYLFKLVLGFSFLAESMYVELNLRLSIVLRSGIHSVSWSQPNFTSEFTLNVEDRI